MKARSVALCLLLLISPLWGADVLDITSEAELDAAIAQAGPGDTLGLAASFPISTPKSIPAGVTLDGNRFSISSDGRLLVQHAAGAVVREVTLATSNHTSWQIATWDRIHFENCFIQSRMIAWANGQIELVDCVVETVITVPPDSTLRFDEPIGVHGSPSEPAVLSATNCVFRLGWAGTGAPGSGRHEALGLFHNFGGNPGTLSVSECTVTGASDWIPDQSSVHMAVFKSEDSVGPSFDTRVSNTVIVADASSIFWSQGSGTVSSSYNNNAGTLRNPLVLAGTLPDAPNFYSYHADDAPVTDKTGDIEEPNPFIDALSGDYRLVASSDSASAAGDGGPLGADLGIVVQAENAYNLNFNRYDGVSYVILGRDEDLFYGWKIHRDVDDQFFLRTEDGFSGRAIRLEAQDTAEETGGGAHNTLVVQSAYQTFVTIPGYQYTIRAYSRRRASSGFSWEAHGQFGNSAMGVSHGVEPDPLNSDVGVLVNGAENSWTPAETTFIASSNHTTVHLIHATNGSWNIGDWDLVTISGAPHIEPASVDAFDLYD